MGGFYDRVGVYNTLTKGYSLTPPETEITQNATTKTEIAAGYFVKFFNWVENLLQNWQLLIIGGIACLIIWKRL